MVAAVTLAPVLLYAWTALRRGALRAFVWVGLPALLLLPNYYTWKLPGIPRFDFHNYLLLLALVGVVAKRELRPRLQSLDAIVLFFVFWCGLSELENKGFHEARNLFVLLVMGIAAPFWLGKALAREQAHRRALIAGIVLLGAIIGFVAPFEARMGKNPFDFWRSLWPQSVPWDGALYRSGLRRVAGPFAHPICHGFFFSLALPLFLCLRPQLRGSSKRVRFALGAGLVMGLAAALSRGPILGTLVALWILGFGWSRRPVAWLGGTAAIALIVVACTFDQIVGYVSIERGEARTESQETAAYRKEMLDNYVEVAGEHPWIGFGKDEIPVVKGLKSIDNQYLFLTLTHGYPAAVAFLAAMLLPALLTIWKLLRRPREARDERLQWTLAALLVGAIITQVTVFSGTQTTQVLFLLEGLCVGLLSTGSRGLAHVSN